MTPKAVVFDMYGTVLAIDGVRNAVEVAGSRDSQAFVDAWRRKQLEYAFLSSMAQAYCDFDDLTERALHYVCAQHALTFDTDQCERLVGAWRGLPAYGDVAHALRDLRKRGIPTAILTNGTRASADAVLRRARVRELFDELLSVEDVRVYKPDPRVYALATEHFACEPRELVFVSSNGWDAWGAAHFGLRVVWCNRSRLPAEQLEPPPEATLGGLDELDLLVARLP